MKYQYENASDLAVDEDFIQWVKSPTPERDLIWKTWLQQYPFHRELVEEARQMVLLLSEDEDELHDFELEAMWEQLNQTIREDDPRHLGEASVVSLDFWQRNRMAAIAASASLLLLLSAFFIYSSLQNNTVEYATAYGAKRTIQLPDKSVVVLNSNSRISFPHEWSESEVRFVQLEGEAFFEVTHKENDQKFVVQTADGVRVEVLGTAFDVSSRGARSRVVLASGKVRLNYEQGNEEKQLVMKPGELVEVSGTTASITRKDVRTELYTSWKENKVVFENTSLQEIAAMLEDVYGYEVTMKEASLVDMKLTAHLDDSGVDNILETVSETLGVTIEKQNQEITISLTNK
ncbi:FecR family protein [Pontibacter pamirensis]|uniref:FecR family protein n=1 Tax=Pontibacter pamirensis TaxID=2562824 RepID=UPI00138A371E|nr:FecR domain-containing protein [Pontibacter pamirensis]